MLVQIKFLAKLHVSNIIHSQVSNQLIHKLMFLILKVILPAKIKFIWK